MALKELFKRGISSLLKRKKTDPVSGDTQKLITYTPEAKKETAKQLAKRDAQVPAKVDRNITDDLLMGESQQPAFGSSTYDWVMRKGPGKYSTDEWIDHLTSTRKVNFKIFGKPSSRIERGPKRFTYDKGSRFAGKEATVNKEELFDTNLATFDDLGNITGGLLGAAKRFNLKLSAQDLGNMIKMNPVNRLKPIEYGGNFNTPKMTNLIQGADDMIVDLSRTANLDQVQSANISQAMSSLKRALREGRANGVNQSYTAVMNELNAIRNPAQNVRVLINQIKGNVDESVRISRGGGNVKQTQYGDETNYTITGW